MDVRELVARLGAGASPEQAREFLEHDETEEAHLLAVLRKRDLPSSLLEAIARHERWNGRRRIKVAVVNHAKTPKTLALRLLNQLFWKELLKVANNFHLPMPVRSTAEKYLRDRLTELELGERITLARTATAGLIPGLVADKNARVIAALLGNPRLREVQVLALVENPASPSEVLRVVGESDRWASRPAVRLAVVTNGEDPGPYGAKGPHVLAAANHQETGGERRDPAGDSTTGRTDPLAAGRDEQITYSEIH